MGKKVTHKKLSLKPSKKRNNILRYALKYIISVVAVYALVSFIYPFFQVKKPVVCANTLSCKESLQFKVDNNSVAIFNNKKVIAPKISLLPSDIKPNVLGVATSSGEKHIYVDLTHQTLYAFEGNSLFMGTFISSGKWHPTPPGDYRIWIKLRATRMSGGSGDDFYDLPNVPYVMFFSNNDISQSAGFSLHGAYWHDNFGHPMSHGCVNMRTIDAQKLYDWVNPPTNGYTTYADANQGTPVTIFGEAP